MLKLGTKRRRTTNQVKAQKEEARLKEESVAQKLAQFAQLQRELEEARALAQNNKNAADILNDLYSQGHVVAGPDGSVTVPSAPKEHV